LVVAKNIKRVPSHAPTLRRALKAIGLGRISVEEVLSRWPKNGPALKDLDRDLAAVRRRPPSLVRLHRQEGLASKVADALLEQARAKLASVPGYLTVSWGQIYSGAKGTGMTGLVVWVKEKKRRQDLLRSQVVPRRLGGCRSNVPPPSPSGASG
jgi:hypothetical protein